MIFSAPMILALLAGKKTVTRRVVRFDGKAARPAGFGECAVVESRAAGDQSGDWFATWPEHEGNHRVHIPCPYGRVGDRLWVRETWLCMHAHAGNHKAHCAACIKCSHNDEHRIAKWREALLYRADGEPRFEGDEPKWTSPIYMPRWASRITLEIVNLRVERLHDITEKDAIAEGVVRSEAGTFCIEDAEFATARDAFAFGWDGINGDRSPFEANDWVWRIEFRRSK